MNRQQDQLLIDLVQKYDHLYNKRNVLYKDKLAKKNAWESIATILNETAEICEQRWTILRNRYCTEKRKYVPSGSGADAATQSWPLFNHMKFIDEFIMPRRTHSSLTRPLSSSSQIQRRQEGSLSSGEGISKDIASPSCSGVQSTQEHDAQEGTSWQVLLAEEEAGVSSGVTDMDMSVELSEITPSSETTTEGYDHEEATSALRLKARNVKKNPATKLADTIHSAFGVLHKHLEKSGPEPVDGDMSFGQTVACGIKKIKSAKKRFLVKAKILQLLAENMSDDEI